MQTAFILKINFPSIRKRNKINNKIKPKLKKQIGEIDLKKCKNTTETNIYKRFVFSL